MMISEKMPRSVPSVGEQRQFPIPSRRSSISCTSDKIGPDNQRMSARHSLVGDSGGQHEYLTSEFNPAAMRYRTSGPVSRAHSPSRVDRRSTICSAPPRESTLPAKVQRWAGLTRSVCNWDGLRKDPELWIEDGECHIHLYAKGASRRGPSFTIPLRALRQKKCGPMLDVYHAETTSDIAAGSRAPRRMQSFDNLNRDFSVVELYIPAPDNASREDSFAWHLTTRNFFAWVMGKPLVGRQMGQAFVDLHERMKLFRSEGADNHREFLDYAENQGYRDLVECTDYALASLYYAERYKLKDVWIDAFAHCVGMSESLATSPEYTQVSRLSKALITRAHLEVDVHLSRVATALRTFLEDDFSPTYLGLAAGARNHLNHFQRFLHQFYVDKFGYWPPPPSTATPFPKALYKSLFYDFQNLYNLLVDTQSNSDISAQKPASGGICVLQTVDHFDRRYNFIPQHHPLPLLPTDSNQMPSRTLSPITHNKQIRKAQSRSVALSAARNRLDVDAANSKIILAFVNFEETYSVQTRHRDEKFTLLDARKVQWLLIYSMLQYLASALRAPNEVRDVDSPEYPLCCFIAGQLTSNATTPLSTPPIVSTTNPHGPDDYFVGANGISSTGIQPDCHREDYFSVRTSGRRSNADGLAPSKSQLPSRQSSMRSFGPLSSLSARSSRRNSLTLKPTGHCAIIVHGYGNGLNQTTTHSSSRFMAPTEQFIDASSSTPQGRPSDENSWLIPQAAPVSTALGPKAETRGHTRTRTPLLHTHQLIHDIQRKEADDLNDLMSRSDSTGSNVSSVWTDGGSAASSKSSANGDRKQFYKASTAEHSGLLGGLVSVDGTRVSLDMAEDPTSAPCPTQSNVHPLLRKAPQQQDGFRFDFSIQAAQPIVSTDMGDAVGIAFSAPPSPPLNIVTSSKTQSMLRSMSFSSGKKPNFPNIRTTQQAKESVPSSRKKVRSSDIFSGLTPSDLVDRYYNSTKKFESPNAASAQPVKLQTNSKSPTHTPTVTKTSHAAKLPSLRDRIWNDENKTEKQERRKSAFWRV